MHLLLLFLLLIFLGINVNAKYVGGNDTFAG